MTKPKYKKHLLSYTGFGNGMSYSVCGFGCEDRWNCMTKNRKKVTCKLCLNAMYGITESRHTSKSKTVPETLKAKRNKK